MATKNNVAHLEEVINYEQRTLEKTFRSRQVSIGVFVDFLRKRHGFTNHYGETISTLIATADSHRDFKKAATVEAQLKRFIITLSRRSALQEAPFSKRLLKDLKYSAKTLRMQQARYNENVALYHATIERFPYRHLEGLLDYKMYTSLELENGL